MDDVQGLTTNKRIRKSGRDVERRFVCSFQGCSKAYTSENSLS